MDGRAVAGGLVGWREGRVLLSVTFSPATRMQGRALTPHGRLRVLQAGIQKDVLPGPDPRKLVYVPWPHVNSWCDHRHSDWLQPSLQGQKSHPELVCDPSCCWGTKGKPVSFAWCKYSVSFNPPTTVQPSGAGLCALVIT